MVWTPKRDGAGHPAPVGSGGPAPSANSAHLPRSAQDAFAKRAEALRIHSIADLASHAPALSMAADDEFFSRLESAGLQKPHLLLTLPWRGRGIARE
jgi:hypothetical protein